MTDLNALLYLDFRIFVNRVRRTLQQPGRLVVWTVFTLWFLTAMASRFYRLPSAQHAFYLPRPWQDAFAFVPAVYGMILGLQILKACRRAPGAFAYPADARFLFGSRLSHRTVVLWLQLRETFFSGVRFLMWVFVLSYTLAQTNRGLVVGAVGLLAAYLIALGIRLPVFLLARRYPRLPLSWLGALLVALGSLSVAYPLWLAYVSGNSSIVFLAAHALQYPPGTWLAAALNGSMPALFALCGLAALTIIAGSLAASDAYPELWESSVRLYAQRVAAAAGRARRSLIDRSAWLEYRDSDAAAARNVLRSTVESAPGDSVPSGALTLVWKEWIALRRLPGGLRWPAVWLATAAAVGYAGGWAARDLSTLMLLGPVFVVSNMIIAMGAQSTISLAGELRKSIWWLGRSEVRDRLLTWSAATLMRLGPPLAVAVLALGVAVHSTLLAVGAVPLVAAVLLLIQTTGLALYTILPGRNDMRGPGFMLRYFATMFLLAPPALMAFLAGWFSHSPLIGGLTGLLFAGLESWLLVAFAAARLEGNGMAYAAAEER